MMDMEALLSGGAMAGMAPGQDPPLMDTAEVIQISSLALLKMLKLGINEYINDDHPSNHLCRSSGRAYGSHGLDARGVRR